MKGQSSSPSAEATPPPLLINDEGFPSACHLSGMIKGKSKRERLILEFGAEEKKI